MKGVKEGKVRKNIDLKSDTVMVLTIAAAEVGLVFKPFVEGILEDLATKKKGKK